MLYKSRDAHFVIDLLIWALSKIVFSFFFSLFYLYTTNSIIVSELWIYLSFFFSSLYFIIVSFFLIFSFSFTFFFSFLFFEKIYTSFFNYLFPLRQSEVSISDLWFLHFIHFMFNLSFFGQLQSWTKKSSPSIVSSPCT